MKLGRSFTFQCTGCGDCCRWPGDVRLTDGDVSRLAAHHELAEAEFLDRFTRLSSNRQGLSLRERPDGACIFLEGDACSVYDARPYQCRTFPYGWADPSGCPGIQYLET